MRGSVIDSRLPFGGGVERGDLSESEWRVLRGLLPIDAASRGPWATARREPFDHQRHPLAAALRHALARCAARIRQPEHDLPSVSALERGRGLGGRFGHASRDDGGQRPLQYR